LALSPDALAALLKIQAPAGPVTLKGKATKLRFFPQDGPPKFCYGRLVLGGASVGFRVDSHSAPSEGDLCLIHGSLVINALNPAGKEWKATHEIELRGSLVGRWQPTTPLTGDMLPVLRRDSGRLSLASWVDQNDLWSLVVIASDEGKPDLQQGLGVGRQSLPRFVPGKFGDARSFLECLKQIDWTGVEGVAIARGGGGGLDEVGNCPEVVHALLGLEIPFYSAMGHTNSVCLIDKFADQAFAVPYAFGTALAQALDDQESHRDREKRWQDGRAEVQRLRAAEAARVAMPSAAPIPTAAPATSRQQPLAVRITPRLVGAALLTLFIVYLWGRHGA
jgi:exodeoxyribonuclease VII large subunit